MKLKDVRILAAKALQVSALALFTSWLFPLVWIGSQIYGRPPNMAHSRQGVRFLRYTWTENPTNPPLELRERIWLSLCIFQKFFIGRIAGLAWLVDEVLYGKQLTAAEIENPFFVISGGRSGSTQITRYLEEDPTLLAPNIMMCMFPYLWLWKVTPYTFGLFFTKDQVREKIMNMMPKEALERHEMDPFGADTFDGPFFSHHFTTLALHISATTGCLEFNLAKFAPHNQQLVEQDLVGMIDGIGRKTMLYHGVQHGSKARYYLKGHFLLAAEALAEKYPKCTMLTVVRDPLKRMQSGINFLYATPSDPYLGKVSWETLTQVVVYMECQYCEKEQEFFNDNKRNPSVKKCVINFQEFALDLPGTMTKVYQKCTEDPVPAKVATMEHPPRDRTNYSLNRSLEDLGVDQDAVRRRLSKYIEWIGSI